MPDGLKRMICRDTLHGFFALYAPPPSVSPPSVGGRYRGDEAIVEEFLKS
jgi:hypothetical protein